MKKQIQRFMNFWFAPLPASRLAILRIATGLFSLWYLLSRYDMLLKLPANGSSMYEPVGVIQFFHEPFTAEIFNIILWATIGFNILYILGWQFRYTGPLFAMLLLLFFCYRNSWSMIYHNFNLLVIHVFIIGFAASGDALSADIKRNNSHILKTAFSWKYGWPVKLICLVTALVYFISGITKISGDLAWNWLSGEAMRSQIAVDSLRKNVMGVETSPFFEGLYAHSWIFFSIGVLTMLVELCAPFILHKKKLILPWILLAFLMHWGIFFMMGIKFYHHMTGIIFFPFLAPEKWWDYLTKKFIRKKDPTSDIYAIRKKRPSIILFDGVCNFCNGAVQFILTRDPKGKFHFASLQSETGRQLLDRYKVVADLSTIVLIENNKLHFKSSAVLRIAGRLQSPWKCLYVLLIIPSAIRNRVYNFIDRHRYKWPGKKAVCEIPGPDISARFLE
jgi:predicted DCC family thiol-disulfide oxidoreductase YuxK